MIINSILKIEDTTVKDSTTENNGIHRIGNYHVMRCMQKRSTSGLGFRWALPKQNGYLPKWLSEPIANR